MTYEVNYFNLKTMYTEETYYFEDYNEMVEFLKNFNPHSQGIAIIKRDGVEFDCCMFG